MSTPDSQYDENLLKNAPAATKAELQEGYNVDLLRQPPADTESRTRIVPASNAPRTSSSDAEHAGLAKATKKVPFWRTTKGIITIAIVLLVIIGAVVGGAVGGTRGGNKKSSSTADTTSTSTTSTSVPQGTGVAQGPGSSANSVPGLATAQSGGRLSSTAALPASTSLGTGQQLQ